MNCTDEWKEYLYEVLTSSEEFDQQLNSLIIEFFRKKKTSDCRLEFLSKDEDERNWENFISQVENHSLQTNQQKKNDVKCNLKKITNIINKNQDHDFNNKGFSSEIHNKLDLMKKLQEDKKIIQFLKFLVHLTALDDQFIQCGSNALNLLVQMKVDLTNQCFENIKIKNVSLVGANFVR